jgi:thiamine biosynthesis lipoprotein
MNEYNYQEQHMGTTASLALVCESQILADTIAKETFSTIKEYEQKFSRFLPSSELSKLNQTGTLTVSEEFLKVLERSLDLVNKTKGSFNPLVQVTNLGYNHSFSTIKDNEATITDRKYNTDTGLIKINQKTKEVTLGENQQLDFGGILKGYLAHLLSENIKKQHQDIVGCIVNIGGDLSTCGHDPFHEPFIFYLYNPITDQEKPVELIDQSMATSGVYKRAWKTNQGTKHHIVETTSQQNPTTDLVSISIIAPDGATAEALCKLFLTQGVAASLEIMPIQTNNYSYFAVTNQGDIQTNIT